MIFVIMNYGVNRNHEGRTWKPKATAFAVAATVCAVTLGVLLGFAGSPIPTGSKPALMVAFACAGTVVSVWQLLGRPVGVPQRNCETAQLWMNTGALTGAALNGGALGLGFVTRIGYSLWFVVPFAALMAGPAKAALIFGLYGLVRGIAPSAIILVMMAKRRCDQKDITRSQEWLIRQSAPAKTVANAILLVASLYAATIIAL